MERVADRLRGRRGHEGLRLRSRLERAWLLCCGGWGSSSGSSGGGSSGGSVRVGLGWDRDLDAVGLCIEETRERRGASGRREGLLLRLLRLCLLLLRGEGGSSGSGSSRSGGRGSRRLAKRDALHGGQHGLVWTSVHLIIHRLVEGNHGLETEQHTAQREAINQSIVSAGHRSHGRMPLLRAPVLCSHQLTEMSQI